MKCQNCGNNEANIRYTQIINGVKKEINLCSECAAKMGVEKLDIPINFNSFLGDFFNDYAETELIPSFTAGELRCDKCGMTYSDFINSGTFGCRNCYDVFENPIDSLLKNLHGTAKHIGRGVLGKGSASKIKEKEINNEEKKDEQKEENNKAKLERELDKAIKDERYEDAAKIRDELKGMK